MSDLAPPPEHRITLRLLSYWEKLRRGRPMPSEQDINPEDIGDLWANCFLVHVRDLEQRDYHYAYLGQAIVDAYRLSLSQDDPGELASPDAGHLAGSYAAVAQSRKPLVEDGEFRNSHHELVKYRQCLLPLGEGGEVLAVFGGMRFRIFPASTPGKF